MNEKGEIKECGESKVALEINEMKGMLNALDELTGTLHTRVSPVLCPEASSASDAGEPKECPERQLCAVAEEIRSMRKSMNRPMDRLRDVLDRLEV